MRRKREERFRWKKLLSTEPNRVDEYIYNLNHSAGGLYLSTPAPPHLLFPSEVILLSRACNMPGDDALGDRTAMIAARLKAIYKKAVLPVEKKYRYDYFYESPLLSDVEFDCK